MNFIMQVGISTVVSPLSGSSCRFGNDRSETFPGIITQLEAGYCCNLPGICTGSLRPWLPQLPAPGKNTCLHLQVLGIKCATKSGGWVDAQVGRRAPPDAAVTAVQLAPTFTYTASTHYRMNSADMASTYLYRAAAPRWLFCPVLCMHVGPQGKRLSVCVLLETLYTSW